MAKKIGVALMGAFLVLIIGFNLVSHFSKNSSNSMSGMFISDLPGGLNISLIAFILQWVILLLVVVFAYMKFLKHKKEEEQKIIDFVIPKPRTKAETNIDVLLNLLKEKGSLTTGTIAKAFNITKEQALDWGKVLEEHGFVNIEYPAFADPDIKFGREKTEEEIKKEKEIKKEEEKRKKAEEQKQKDIKKEGKTKQVQKQKPTQVKPTTEEKKPVEKQQAKPEQEKVEQKEQTLEDKGRAELEKKLQAMENKQRDNLDQYKPK